MNTINKMDYETPASTVVEVKTEGIVCTSPVTLYVILGNDPVSGPSDYGVPDYGNGGSDTW